MKVVILAGGKGTRLAPLIPDIPKPLVEVQGQVFLKILLRYLLHFKFTEVTLAVGHLSEQFVTIQSELTAICPKLQLHIESQALGTGGALREVVQSWSLEEPVLVLNGDTFFDIDLRKFIENSKLRNSLALRQVPDVSRYGHMQISGDNIVGMSSAGTDTGSGLINAGIYLLIARDVLELLPSGASSLEHQLFPELIQQKSLKGFQFDGNFIDIGVPEDYRRANEEFDFRDFIGKKTKPA